MTRRVTLPPPARIWIDAFLTAYWFALDQPQEVDTGIEKPCAGRPAGRRRRRDRMGACRDVRGHRTDHQAGGRRQDGYAVASRFFDSPYMRFNIIDAHVSALLLVGQMADGLEVAQQAREQSAEMPGAAHLLGTAIAGRSPCCSLVVLTRRVPCWDRQRPHCRRRGMAIGWGYRYHIPYATALAMRGATDEAAAVLAALDIPTVHFASWITSAAWPAHGWRLGRAPSPRRSARCWQQPKPQRPTGNWRQN